MSNYQHLTIEKNTSLENLSAIKGKAGATMLALSETNGEVFFERNEIIVSKTDLKGRITYANSTFMKVSGFKESELIGEPHSLIRHPDMPRAIFKLLWETLAARNEVFAYVKNLTKDGGFYWVFAHVTPSLDMNREVVGYHSNRRVPRADIVRGVIEPVYRDLLATEQSEPNRKNGLAKSYQQLTDLIRSKSRSYDEFIFSL